MPTLARIKRMFRKHVFADGRFSPDVTPANRDRGLEAHRLDDGRFPIIYTSQTPYAPLGAANYVGRAIAAQPAVFLVWFSWTMRKRSAVRWLSTVFDVYRHRRPHHRIVLLCNETEEFDALSAAGVEAIHCNHNAFVDEGLFKPVAEVTPAYDAVYNGAMARWKRHDLSRLVDKCALVFYRKPNDGPDATMAYLAELRRQLPGHDFINPVVDGDISPIDRAAVNMVLARSRVGLCLSAEEGAMFASMEYLLAGLPVVSTENIGGRDTFADPEYWLTVADTPEAVRDGVAEMISRNLPREQIRARALEKVFEHRERLRAAVARVTDGAAQLPADLSDPVYRQRLEWVAGSKLAARLGLG